MLTEKIVRETKPREKPFMLCDAGGLYLHVAVSGRKTWIYRKQRRGQSAQVITLGVYPEMSLYAARQARDEAAGAARRDTAGAPTFRELAEKWLDAIPRRSCTPRHVERTETRLRLHILPVIGAQPVAQLTSPRIYQLVHEVEGGGQVELAHRLAGLIGQILRFGIPLGVVPQGDVTRDLRGSLAAIRATPRAHLEKPAEVGALMRKIMDMPAGMVRAGLLLQAYTFTRPGELRAARWDEIDLNGATWKIPAEKMKMRRPHIVPLSLQSVAVLTYLRDGLSAGSPLVLHGVRSLTRPLSDMALLSALRDLGYSKSEMSVHGFRSIASTLLNESGWPPDAIEAQLAHYTGGTVRAVYNYAQYMETRRAMVQWYADYLDALAAGAPIPEKPKH